MSTSGMQQLLQQGGIPWSNFQPTAASSTQSYYSPENGYAENNGVMNGPSPNLPGLGNGPLWNNQLTVAPVQNVNPTINATVQQPSSQYQGSAQSSGGDPYGYHYNIEGQLQPNIVGASAVDTSVEPVGTLQGNQQLASGYYQYLQDKYASDPTPQNLSAEEAAGAVSNTWNGWNPNTYQDVQTDQGYSPIPGTASGMGYLSSMYGGSYGLYGGVEAVPYSSGGGADSGTVYQGQPQGYNSPGGQVTQWSPQTYGGSYGGGMSSINGGPGGYLSPSIDSSSSPGNYMPGYSPSAPPTQSYMPTPVFTPTGWQIPASQYGGPVQLNGNGGSTYYNPATKSNPSGSYSGPFGPDGSYGSGDGSLAPVVAYNAPGISGGYQAPYLNTGINPYNAQSINQGMLDQIYGYQPQQKKQNTDSSDPFFTLDYGGEG
ncbi:MAG TPA: hypothetical protein V6C86_24110 [Oculatellaceae cyanobacterium]